MLYHKIVKKILSFGGLIGSFLITSLAKAQDTILPPGNPENTKLDDLMSMITRIENIALALGGGIAVIFILIGAFQYLTAFGNEEKANKGKTTVTWALIGVAIIILAKVVIYEVGNLIYSGNLNL